MDGPFYTYYARDVRLFIIHRADCPNCRHGKGQAPKPHFKNGRRPKRTNPTDPQPGWRGPFTCLDEIDRAVLCRVCCDGGGSMPRLWERAR